MDRLLLFVSILVFAVAASYAAVPGQDYWNKVLPNTPMPSAITSLLAHDELREQKTGTSVNVGKGGVNVNTGKGKPGGTSVNVGNGHVGVNTGKGKPGGTSVGVGKGGVSVNTGKGKPGGTTVNVGKGGVIVNTPQKKKPVVVRAGGFNYLYAATETQIRDDPSVALFFLEKDIHPGTKMTMHFTPTTSGSAFIPRREANSFPFASSKLSEVFDRLSIQPDSVEAESMKQTLSECEEPAIAGETRYCATSLESMVEFSTLSLGTRNVLAVSTTVGKENSPKQQYTIGSSSGVERLSGSGNLVVCHAQPYAYAVFYCHTTKATKAYKVSLVGKDGTTVKAVAVCHTDTAKWNPKHVAFQVLGVKPGTVPVCHFLPQDHLVWSTKN